jgi:hypothetical protein
MYCKFFKIKQKKGSKFFYCKKTNKAISLNECKSCIYKEYKKSVSNKPKRPLKQISKKRAKLERKRFSIFTDNLDKCYFCNRPRDDLHELLGGRNRNNSMRYGLVLPVCREHHNEIQHSIEYKKMTQKKFQEVYPEIDFVDIFKINYL